MDLINPIIERPGIWLIILAVLIALTYVLPVYVISSENTELRVINGTISGLSIGAFVSILLYMLIERRDSVRWKLANKRFHIELLNICSLCFVEFLSRIKQLSNIPVELVQKKDGKIYEKEGKDENRRLFCKTIQRISEGKLDLTITEEFKKLEDEDYLKISSYFKSLNTDLVELVNTMPNRIKPEQFGYISEMIRASSNLSMFSEQLTLDLTDKGISKERLFELNIRMFNKDLQTLSSNFWKLLNSDPKFKEWGYLVS